MSSRHLGAAIIFPLNAAGLAPVRADQRLSLASGSLFRQLRLASRSPMNELRTINGEHARRLTFVFSFDFVVLALFLLLTSSFQLLQVRTRLQVQLPPTRRASGGRTDMQGATSRSSLASGFTNLRQYDHDRRVRSTSSPRGQRRRSPSLLIIDASGSMRPEKRKKSAR